MIQKQDGTPVHVVLDLAEVVLEGNEVQQLLRFNNATQAWNTQQVSTDEKGRFVLDVDRKFFDPNAQYSLILNAVSGNLAKGALSWAKGPLVFKVTPMDPQLDLGVVILK